MLTRRYLRLVVFPLAGVLLSAFDASPQELDTLLQELGCAWVTLHARTRQQKFGGRADWDHVARLVARLEPVEASPDDEMDETGADRGDHRRVEQHVAHGQPHHVARPEHDQVSQDPVRQEETVGAGVGG